MQQELKFPAQCALIPTEEQEYISGGAPAWVEQAKDKLRPIWHQVKPWLSFGVELGKVFVQVIGSAYAIYVYGKIIKNSMEGIKDTMNWFGNLS